MSGIVVRNFNGRSFIAPTVASDIVSVPSGEVGAGSIGKVIVVGESTGCLGGAPATDSLTVPGEKVVTLVSQQDAIARLKSGSGLDAVLKVFAPSNNFAGANQVGFLRVNPATKGSAVLKDAGTNSIIDVISLDYGVYVNAINLAVAAGTSVGKKLTVVLSDTYVVDNIILNSLKIKFTGSCSTAVVKTTSTGIVTTIDGGAGLTLLYSAYPTIADMVAAINANANYTATVLTPDSTDLSNQLDIVTDTDIHGTYATLDSLAQAMIDAVNSIGLLVSASLHSAAVRKPIADTIVNVYLSGGTEGSVINQNWLDAATDLEVEDVQLIVIASDDTNAYPAFATHAANMSAPGGNRERQIIGGSGLALSVADAITKAQSIDSKYFTYVYPGIKYSDLNGTLTTYPGYIAAAAFAGIASGFQPKYSISQKTISCIGVEKAVSTTERDNLILAGICPVMMIEGTAKFIRSVTTYQTPDLKFAEFSIVRTMMLINRDLRAVIAQILEMPGDASVITTGKNLITYKLNEEVQAGNLVADPNDPIGNPAFKNVQFKLIEDYVTIDFDGNVVAPINFVFVTSHFSLLIQK